MRAVVADAPDDAALTSAVRKGDAIAAGIFCQRVQSRVRAVVYRLMGRDDPDRDDAEQQALVALVEGIDGYRGEGPLDAWAGTVAARVVYKHIRRRRLERKHFSVDELPTGTSNMVTPLEPTVARDLLGRVHAHLSVMDDERAWTFLLHDVCGFDLHEVAIITDVTVAAAQKRLCRGRQEIHARIAGDAELIEALERLRGSS